MCLRPYHLKYQTFDGSWRESDVPCGKCPECIRRAQTDMMILVSRQLQSAKGKSWFVTLSYKDDKLPLSYVCTRYSYGRPLAPYETDILAQDRHSWTLLSRSKPCRLSRAPFRTGNPEFDSIVCPFPDRLKWSYAAQIPSRLVAREDAVRAAYGRRFRWNGVSSGDTWTSSPCSVGRCIKPGCVLELGRWIEDGCINVVTAACSVDRKDVQLWLKNCRVAFERQFGRKLSSFSYLFVQEYGPKGHRPHYHLIFSDIEESELTWMLDRWAVKYTGFAHCHRKSGSGVVYDEIASVTSKGGYGCVSAGRYLGSYMKKLASQDDHVMVCGLCSRPRKCSSKFFGLGGSMDFCKLRCFLLGYDVFGAYDVADPSSYGIDMEELFDVVKRRQNYVLPSSSSSNLILGIPQYLKLKIYKDVKQKKSFRKVPCRWTSLSFDSYCESAGFGSRPSVVRPCWVAYPCSSELSQGLADIEAFRADLVHTQELYAFAGVSRAPGKEAPEIPGDVLVSFADSKDRAKRARWSELESNMRDKYKKSKY